MHTLKVKKKNRDIYLHKLETTVLGPGLGGLEDGQQEQLEDGLSSVPGVL